MKLALRSFAAATALALSFSAQAAGVTLASLLSGGSVVAGALQFDNWSVDYTDASDPLFAFNFANIEVSALPGGMSPGPGLQFDISNSHMAVGGDGFYAYKSLIFSYRVTLLDALLRIVDNSTAIATAGASVLFAPDNLNDLGVEISGVLGIAAGASDLGVNTVGFDVLDDIITDNPAAASAFGPRESLFVSNSILVWSADVGDVAALQTFRQRFALEDAPTAQVPVPGSLALAVIALLAAAATARRQAKRK